MKKTARTWPLLTKVLSFLPMSVCLLAIVVVGMVLTLGEDVYLWKVQELNLFLYTKLFFEQQLVVPGGLLTYLGTYFTQYFYHPWIGVTMLCLWWALLMWLTKRTFNVSRQWLTVLLIPVALLLLTDFTLGYWIYYLKLRGHFFVTTIGLSAAMAGVWAYRSLPQRYGLRSAFIVVFAAIGYPLLGAYALLGTLLMGISTWGSRKKLMFCVLDTLLAVAAIALVPQICYRHVFYQTNIDDIYRAALPLFEIEESHPDYYIPYYLLAAFYIVLAVGSLFAKRLSAMNKPAVCYGLQTALVAVLVWGTVHFWYNDYNFYKELRMQRAMNNLDWQGMLDEAADLQEEPNRAIVMMKNLALFRMGKQGDLMYHYRTGAKPCDVPFPIRMTQIIGKDIYYNYGMPNYCYRWCLEDGVEFGWRAEFLKHLTRCAMLNGEYRVASKYINILKQTKYHREWAEQQQRLLGKDDLVRSDKAYGPIFPLMTYEDHLASDQSLVERFLMEHFITDVSKDPVYQEQALLAALWKKDIATFWAKFFPYASSHIDQHMPIHFQEAAYLYGQLEPWRVDISGMPFDQEVKDSYQKFMQQATQLSKAGNSEEQIRELLFDAFGHTFYFEYYLVRNQKLY